MRAWWVGLMLAGCIQQVPRGPDLGRCADLPDGVYGYGEAGIGTCLAGPADLKFFQQDGGTFLAVTNADPFRHYRTGSVLVLDWDGLAEILDEGPPDRLTMDEVPVAGTIEILDDDDGDGVGDNPFLGGFGYLPAHQAAVVASRLSEGSTLRSGRDQAFVLDLTEMELGDGIRHADTLQLEDDPFHVVVDDATQRVYVSNLTDHSVSVLSTRSELGGPDDIVAILDVAPDAGGEAEPIEDVDGSGSLATVSRLAVTDPVEVVEDVWTMTYIDGTVRLFVPTPIDDQVVGVVRYTSGDAVTFAPTAFGPEVGLAGEVLEPFSEVDLATGIPVLWFTRSDGAIYRARSATVGGAPVSGEWVLDDQPVLAGAGSFFGSPSVAPLEGSVGLYVSRRREAGGDAEVGLAVSADNVAFAFERTVLAPPPGTSYDHPFVALDPRAHRYRMWLTVRTGDGSSIALSESDDGRAWSEPVTVLAGDAAPVAAPSVAVLDGRYVLYYARDDGTAWTHAAAWSWDGRTWYDLGDVAASPAPYDPLVPPRVAVRAEIAGAWRVEGVDAGQISSLLPAGAPPLQLVGFELAVANGHEVANSVIPDRGAARGLIPGSAIVGGENADRELLFVTTLGRGTRSEVAILERDPDGELLLAVSPPEMGEMLDLAPGESVSDPLVARDDEGFVLFVTVQGQGGPTLRRATSDDGLAWSALSGDAVLAGEATFDAGGQYAHAVEALDGGGFRLWYTGTDGAILRIGSATGDSLRGPFAREEGPLGPWRLGTGGPGEFDDSGVSHPLVIEIDGVTHLYYTGFDGTSRHVGHAVVEPDGTITRRIDPGTDLAEPAMDGLARTFSQGGVERPVLAALQRAGPGVLEVWYAGCDLQCGEGEGAWRLGRAAVSLDVPDEMYALQRFPTAGDRIGFVTRRGGPGAQVIELEQSTAELQTLGWGMSDLTLDPDRGFLYATTKLDDLLYVLDVHDDTDGDFVDANALDLEAVVPIDTGNALAGFRDLIVARQRGLGILTGRNPEQLVFVDLDRIPDDASKDQVTMAAVGVIPMESSGEDAGVDTLAVYGGGRMALDADERLLLVPHFRGNALSVFDLQLGAWGEEIAWLPNLGENPHLVEISPDGRWAVVANYLGDVDGDFVSSTLAIVDLDPTSDRYLEAVTWLANR